MRGSWNGVLETGWLVEWLPDVSVARSAARANSAACRPKARTSSGGRTFRTSAEQDAGDRTREHQVSDLGDDRDRGEPRVDVLAEGPVPLTGFDRDAEPLEETGRQRSNRGFGVGGLPVDQLTGEQDREVRVGRKDGDLAFNDGCDDGFRRGVLR